VRLSTGAACEPDEVPACALSLSFAAAHHQFAPDPLDRGIMSFCGDAPLNLKSHNEFSKLGNMLSNPQSSSWQEKLSSSFCVIKYIVFAMLAVEAAVAFFIILRLRIAWAVMLNRFGGWLN
jgi:hypothetical protein